MTEKKSPKNQYYVQLPLLLTMALCIGIVLGAKVFQQQMPIASKKSQQHIQKIKNILSYIDKYYVDSVDIEYLVEESIHNMLEKLDPHTTYIPAKEQKLQQTYLEGSFEGIGIKYNIFNDTVYVVKIISGGPSEKVGLLAGDQIIEIDRKKLSGTKISSAEVIHWLRGKKGSKVNVSIRRQQISNLLYFDITRDKIPTHTVDVGIMLNDSAGYININRFGSKTHEEFREKLKSLLNQGMKKLILDLRDNGGGYMDQAVKVADELLKEEQLIVYTKGRQSNLNYRAYAENDGLFEEGQVFILINENTASASEIVSGALQDHDRALIIGRRSFGKGLVQRRLILTDNSELRITTSRYYTPSGRSIQKPYGNGINYNNEVNERYQNGEFFTVDNDQIKRRKKQYHTDNKKVVYSGGGITPDIFVPLDTNYYSSYYTEISNKNLLQSFALHYYLSHKEKLSKSNSNNFCADKKMTHDMLQAFIVYAQKNGVESNILGYEKSKEKINNLLCAHIARNQWGEEAFHQIFLKKDNVLKKALFLN